MVRDTHTHTHTRDFSGCEYCALCASYVIACDAGTMFKNGSNMHAGLHACIQHACFFSVFCIDSDEPASLQNLLDPWSFPINLPVYYFSFREKCKLEFQLIIVVNFSLF